MGSLIDEVKRSFKVKLVKIRSHRLKINARSFVNNTPGLELKKLKTRMGRSKLYLKIAHLRPTIPMMIKRFSIASDQSFS